jgi:hypothetical protein
MVVRPDDIEEGHGSIGSDTNRMIRLGTQKMTFSSAPSTLTQKLEILGQTNKQWSEAELAQASLTVIRMTKFLQDRDWVGQDVATLLTFLNPLTTTNTQMRMTMSSEQNMAQALGVIYRLPSISCITNWNALTDPQMTSMTNELGYLLSQMVLDSGDAVVYSMSDEEENGDV